MMKYEKPLLVDGEKLVNIFLRSSMASTYNKVYSLVESWYKIRKNAKVDTFEIYSMYTYLFEAGRVQGIREERQRRRRQG